MTEPIDQATKDLIEKEAEEYSFGVPFDGTENFYDKARYEGYTAGATVWAEKLKQKRELIKELVEHFRGLISQQQFTSNWPHTTKQIESLIQKAKDKSHE